MNHNQTTNTVQAISKQSSALGINLSNIRASGASIRSSAPTGFSGLVSFDAASMYPSMMSNSSYKLEQKSYHVSNNWPFQVKRMAIEELFNDGAEEWFKSKSYERRYDAEKASLEKLCEWSDGNWEQDMINKKKLETFDEDHPEWLI